MMRRSRTLRALSAIRRFRSDTAAGPIVEFAVVVPVLLYILINIFELAWAFQTRHAYVTAVREGARYAAVSANPCGEINAIKQVVNSRLDSPVSLSSIIVTSRPNGCVIPSDERITVRIDRVPYAGITGVSLLRFLGSAVNLSASATFRWERAS